METYLHLLKDGPADVTSDHVTWDTCYRVGMQFHTCLVPEFPGQR